MVLNEIMVWLGIIIALYILYKFLFTRSKVDDDYHEVYNKVLTSEEYKVKGQYDK